MKLSRRRWLTRSLFYGSPFIGFGYGSVVEKRWLTAPRTVVPLAPEHAILDGLKLAVMGDFHHDDYGSQSLIRQAVSAVNEAGVDYVFLVGDYVSRDPRGIVPLCEELADLRPRRGTFAVFGNHDRLHYDPILESSLRQAGARLLVNEAVDCSGFSIVGVDSSLTGKSRLAETLHRVPEGQPVLLLWHEPDTFAQHSDPRIALQVSGHTHGGQICAPFIGPLLLPVAGKKYPYGLYRRGPSSLYVTRGIGTLTIPARFLCAPEVAMLDLAL